MVVVPLPQTVKQIRSPGSRTSLSLLGFALTPPSAAESSRLTEDTGYFRLAIKVERVTSLAAQKCSVTERAGNHLKRGSYLSCLHGNPEYHR